MWPATSVRTYRGAQGLDPEFIKKLEKQFGFDKPPLERFCMMLWNYIRLRFRRELSSATRPVHRSHYRKDAGVDLARAVDDAADPTSISIPLGIRKAVKDGSRFDTWTSAVVIVGYAIPGVPVRDPADRAVCRRLVLADWFPLRGLRSDNWDQLSWPNRIVDYIWHMALPLTALVLSAFATTDAAHQELVPGRDPQAVCA